MLIATTDNLPDREIAETLGLVKGNVIRAKHIGSDIVAGLRNLVGGEVTEYTQLMAAAREQAMDRMIEDAERLGADAIVGTRFSTATITQGGAEMLAFGTAVKLK